MTGIKPLGVAFSAKISPGITSRVVDSCRAVLNKVLPDVHIEVDHWKGTMMLIMIYSCVHCIDCMLRPSLQERELVIPPDIH